MHPQLPQLLAKKYCDELESVAQLLEKLAAAFTAESPADVTKPDWLRERADTLRLLIARLENEAAGRPTIA